MKLAPVSFHFDQIQSGNELILSSASLAACLVGTSVENLATNVIFQK